MPVRSTSLLAPNAYSTAAFTFKAPISSMKSLVKTEIAAGVNLTIVKRVLPMLARFPKGPIVFSGGVAKNKAVPLAFAMLLDKDIIVPPDPELMGWAINGKSGLRFQLAHSVLPSLRGEHDV